jgi:hypothetical protein
VPTSSGTLVSLQAYTANVDDQIRKLQKRTAHIDISRLADNFWKAHFSQTTASVAVFRTPPNRFKGVHLVDYLMWTSKIRERCLASGLPFKFVHSPNLQWSRGGANHGVRSSACPLPESPCTAEQAANLCGARACTINIRKMTEPTVISRSYCL